MEPDYTADAGVGLLIVLVRMFRMRHILLGAVLLALTAVSCKREPVLRTDPELQVSLYIPTATITKAETGTVNPLAEELKITSLQIWAFLSEDGTLVSYKNFTSNLERAGVSNSTIIRFGLPLSQEMFDRLTATDPRPKVDVYAVANVASATNSHLDESTTRADLDAVVINRIGGNSPLTMAVPEAGLPMSGVIKNGDVTGGYPVLNITTLKLIRAVSKIRFVFCQQGIPATETTPATAGNEGCEIVGISFDGGEDCQIGASERLFTANTFDLGDTPAYTPLSASIFGNPLIPNNKLSIVEDPEVLSFRGFGNETESAEHYEQRLDAAVAPESQVGPIYLRETDKRISGTISYRIASDEAIKKAHFLMPDDVFSRNHTWIVYACFVEETMKLSLKVVVLPWEWTSYHHDFKDVTVNVVRRFTVFDTPVPTFKKVQTSDGFFDVSFWHTVTVDEMEMENAIHGDITIASPVGGTLHVIPVPGKDAGSALTDAFIVRPAQATIYPNYASGNGRIEDCRIPIAIYCNPAYKDDTYKEELEGNYIDLHFCVETPDGRYIDLGSESIDYYRFILKKEWNQ